MRKIVLYVCSVFILLFCSCGNNKLAKTNSENPINTDLPNVFHKINDSVLIKETKLPNESIPFCSPVDFEISINETDAIRNITLSFNNYRIRLTTFFEHEYTYLIWNETPPIITEFNFTRDIRENGFIIFKCDNNFVMALPSYSEEFNTYELIKLPYKGKAKSLNLHSYKKMSEGIEDSYVLRNDNSNYTLISKDNKGNILNVYDNVYEGENLFVKAVYPKVETYLNIRSAPNVDSSKVIEKAYLDTKLYILGDIGEWSIVYSKGVYGYVSSEFVK